MPSKAILEQKQEVVKQLAESIRNSVAGVIVNYQGITVEDDTKMRKALREAGVKYSVVKNSLTGRACDEVGYSEIKAHLNGMTAIAISDNDPIAAAKIFKEYAEKVESFEVIAGYLEGNVIDKSTVLALAEIPSKEVLIAKFLGSIKSPVYSLAYALQAVIDKDGQPAEEAANAPAEEAPATEA